MILTHMVLMKFFGGAGAATAVPEQPYRSMMMSRALRRMRRRV